MHNFVTGVVTRVECVGVSVQWQYQTPISPMEQELLQKKETSESPPVDIKPSKLNTNGAEEEREIEKEPEKEKELERKKPADFITGEDLKRMKSLNLFDACTVQLGDTSYYTVPPNATPLDKRTWQKEKRVYLLASTLNEKLATTKLDEEYTSTDNEGEDGSSTAKNDEPSESYCNNRSDSCTTVVSVSGVLEFLS